MLLVCINQNNKIISLIVGREICLYDGCQEAAIAHSDGAAAKKTEYMTKRRIEAMKNFK
ncbi:hypothetical protein [Tissierella praeacuta]|uniref:hypothetical protein n=1 Tax=Tissierella praeacuta TaxID=43131 RepID=UPI00333ECC97